MPLSILVGVLNIEKTFLFQLYFITSDTTTSFEFIEDQLGHFFFHNCLRPKIICSDFAKEPASATARNKARYQQAGNGNTYIFQLYKLEWVEAIQRHLVADGEGVAWKTYWFDLEIGEIT